MKFQDKWTEYQESTSLQKVKNTVHTEKPLRPRIDSSVHVLQKQKQVLDSIISKIEMQDKKLFGKVVVAKNQMDTSSAKSIAFELAELRKLKRMMYMVRSALERVEIRLTGYGSLGDAISAIAPVVRVLRSTGSLMDRFIPSATQEIGHMAGILEGHMTGMTERDSFGTEQSISDESVRTIMEEAGAVVAESVNSRFPSTPNIMTESQTSNARQT